MALARSKDGKKFVMDSKPILEPTPNTLDDHGFTSPSIVRWKNQWVLIYSGWCIDTERCPRAKKNRFTTLLSATSSDGVSWRRQYTELLPDTQLPAWAPDGIAETHVFEARSGEWVLLFTALTDKKPMSVGLATSNSPLGPWSIYPNPILTVNQMSKWADK